MNLVAEFRASLERRGITPPKIPYERIKPVRKSEWGNTEEPEEKAPPKLCDVCKEPLLSRWAKRHSYCAPVVEKNRQQRGKNAPRPKKPTIGEGPNALAKSCEKCGAPCRRKMCLPCSNQKHAQHNETGKSARDLEIIARLNAGENPKVIALDYDLTPQRVKQIRERAA